MKCSKCGGTYSDELQICPRCGIPLTSESSFGRQQDPLDQTGQYANPNPIKFDTPIYKLGWHKFLVNFSLWLAAITFLGNGIPYIFQNYYEMSGGSTEYVYYFFPSLQVLDVIYGILLVGLSAFTIYVRFQLAKFRQKAPLMLSYLYIAVIAVTSIYYILLFAIIDSQPDYIQLITNNAMSVAMLVINHIYYKKRAALFVN